MFVVVANNARGVIFLLHMCVVHGEEGARAVRAYRHTHHHHSEVLGFEYIQSSLVISFSNARSAPKVSLFTCELVSNVFSSHALSSSAIACA